MAGVVAMASVIEDFDTQPCKKSCKDGSSSVKTIPNYFSPLAKAVEKPFSPPRTNNIMDYFCRKTPSTKEKSSPSEQYMKCQTSQLAAKSISPEAGVKQPSQKRGRKIRKAARKLVVAERGSVSDDVSCLIVEEPHESKDVTAEKASGILGSDTAAHLPQISADACDTAEMSKSRATVSMEQVEIVEHDKDDSKHRTIFHIKSEQKSFPSSSVVPSNDDANRVQSAKQNSGKGQQKDQTKPEPNETDAENSIHDVSVEDNVEEASQLNSSTVTISFEDFVRSHSQDSDEEGTEDENEISKEVEKIDSDQLDISKTEENLGSGDASLQISPRTLTIQAEVHVLSAKQETVKAGEKLASIFTRKKGASIQAEAISSLHAEAETQLPCTFVPVKRKSNVVVQEEDLELAVLESESLPKCSVAERRQFMAAFKQPSQDGSKAKPGKCQGKLKQTEDENLGADEEDAAVPLSTEEIPASSQEGNAVKKKLPKKGRKKEEKAKDEKETVTPGPAVETVTTIDNNKEESPVTSPLSIPRRSKREAVARNAPETTPTIPIKKNRKLNKSKDTAAAALPDSPLKMSTPKTHKSKHRVYVAEMVCSPDTKESPIRMKFTKVHKNVSRLKAESESDLTPPLTKTSNELKKRKQAKKLVEKAKVIQHIKSSCIEEKGTLRRSSRNKTSINRSFCEDEDSIICVEVDPTQTAYEKSKTTKALRSLNDVLGKVKETKSVPGKSTSPGKEKTARKVSIFDESSREGSENSQDDEQFRARREFLKSGLPESFRKQIAKTAASKEAHCLSCSSFQPVIHMKQPLTDCPLWSLQWPQSPLLGHLKEIWSLAYDFLPSVSGSFCFKTEPASKALCERHTGWRPEIPESVRQLLMKEISTSNPTFPVQMFITRLLKRRTDHQQQCTASDTSLPAEPAGGKRKRMDDEGESTFKVSKKQRATPEPESTKRGGRTRRSQRSTLEEKEEPARTSNKAFSHPSKDDSVIIVDNLLLEEDTGKEDVVKEEVLWTDKYQPQHSSDIIGNSGSVKGLHSWLKEWKLRADREERKKQKDKKQEEDCNDSDWDCGEDNSQDGEDMLCNTMLITGPTGVGKTAAVYACAQELGFKVFEVNASSQRSGRLILSQLKEATQSHQVDSRGVNAHKPTYFNSYSTSSNTGSVRPGSSPRKLNSPRRVVSSPRKHPQSPRGAKRGSLAPTTLANFFKMGPPGNSNSKQAPNTMKKKEQLASSKKALKEVEDVSKNKDLHIKSPTASNPNEEQSKKMATSLILFEEVDVIFDEDSGFLAAIKTFMATTKRPVILTTNDHSFGTTFDGNFEEIHFKTPSVLNVGSYLQLLCLAEDMRTELSDIRSLLRLNGCDIRQSLLQLQFWTRSAGGRHTTRPLTHTVKSTELKPETDGKAADMSMSTLPPCDTGCTESRLGLFNIEPERNIWDLLRQRPVEEAICCELLTDSRRRGVDLLYSNMETLLPLPLMPLTTSTHKLQQFVLQNHKSGNTKGPVSDTLPSHTRILHNTESADCSDDGSPVKVSNRMKKNKRRRCLTQSDSDSEDSFLSLCKSSRASQLKEEEVKEGFASEIVKRKPLTPGERVKRPLVTQCLESMADFLDNMSYMDSSLVLHSEVGEIYRRTSQVGAVVKDGMTDESRFETDIGSWMRGERVLEIQAAVETLNFHRCQTIVAEAWDKAQKLEGELGEETAAELTLPVASHCEGYSFTQDDPCQPQLVQERKAVFSGLILRNLVGTFGNRAAAAQDYLPALRTICRSEQLKEQGKVKRRFLHYLDAIHLGLDKSTLHHLAEDFP